MTPQLVGRRLSNTVLVVEDDANIREVLRILFELEGFDALWSSTGKEALECLERLERKSQGAPRLILVDGKLPDMLGPDLVRVMRRRLPTECSVYLFSADPNFVQWGWKSGEISGFIHKPFDSDELVNLIQSCLKVSSGIRISSSETASA